MANIPAIGPENADCIIGISPHERLTSVSVVRSLGEYAQAASRRDWYDDITLTTWQLELPILCDRDFFLQLPSAATLRKTSSGDEALLAHATEIDGGVGGSHRTRVQQTLRSAKQEMEEYGLDWPLIVGHRCEMSMISRLAVREGLNPIFPADLPPLPGLHPVEDETRWSGTHRMHMPAFLKFR